MTQALLLNASNNPIAQKRTYVTGNVALSNIQIGVPNFSVENTNECLSSLTLIGKYVIEYPIGSGTLYDVTWAGQKWGVFPPSKVTQWSDPVQGLSLPAGSVYSIRQIVYIQNLCYPSFSIVVSGGAITGITGNAITSMVWLNGTVLATCGAAHGYPIGAVVPMTFFGVAPSAYNGQFPCTILSTTTFEFPLPVNPGTVTTQGTYVCFGASLQTAPTFTLSSAGIGAGSGGALGLTWGFAVSPRISIGGAASQTPYTGSTGPTAVTSGGGGTVQPTWLPIIRNGYAVDYTQVTPGSNDFTSAPTMTVSGGTGGNAGSITCYLANGSLTGLPTITTAGSGYTNGTKVIAGNSGAWSGGLSLQMANYTSEFNFLPCYVKQGSSAVDNTWYIGSDSATAGYTYTYPVFARGTPAAPSSCVGVSGTSLAFGYNDTPNANGHTGWIARSLAGEGVNGGNGGQLTAAVPFVSVARGSSDLVGFLGSSFGSRQLLQDCGITHVIMNHQRNDLANNLTSAALISLSQEIWQFWLNLGVTVYQETISPTSTSTDGWATTANQTTWAQNAQQQLFNSALRTNYASYGINLIDVANVLEYGGAAAPSGLWNVSGSAGYGAGLLASISGASVSGAIRSNYAGEVPSSAGYLGGGSGTLPIVFYGGGGSGAAGTVTVTSGVVQSTGITITSGGTGFTAPPVATVAGAWTVDGVHCSPYGYTQVVLAGLYKPSMFAL